MDFILLLKKEELNKETNGQSWCLCGQNYKKGEKKWLKKQKMI